MEGVLAPLREATKAGVSLAVLRVRSLSRAFSPYLPSSVACAACKRLRPS